MADEQVGTVSVKVLPDTKGFRAKLKAELEKIEDSLEMTLELGVRLSRADLLRARRELKALEKGAAIKVKMELDKSGILAEVRRIIADANDQTIAPKVKPAPWDIGEFTRGMREAIDKAVADVDASVPVELRDQNYQDQLQSLIEDANRLAKVEVTAELDDSEFRRKYAELRTQITDTVSNIKIDADVKAAQAQLEGFLQQMRDKSVTLPVELDGVTEAALQAEELARSRELDIHAVLHAARAAAQIAVLTHSRTLDVRAHLSGSAIGQIAGLLAGLSGGRTLYDLTSQVSDFVAELDRSIPRIATMATGIAGIGAVTLGAGGALAGFVTGVGDALRGLLIMPAAIAGVVTVFQVLKAAFRDAGQYIGDLGVQYSALGDQISAGYWSVAEGSIRSFTAAFIPLASTWLPRVGVELGYATEAISKAVTESRGLENLEGLFRNMVSGLDTAAGGFGDLTRAILDLAEAGSRQFPALAGWFRQMMRDFEGWTERVTNDGSFDRWMGEAGQAARDLGSLLSSTTRIFNAFADAAEAAGSPSLSDLAAGLRTVADAAESTRGMEFMTTMLAGANTAIKNMVPGLRDLGSAFVDLAPQMASVMAISGDIFSELFSGLADILENPTFKSGLVDMFEGFRSAMENLRPAFHTMGTDIGMLFETFGMLAEAIGRVVGVASQELGTVFQDLLKSIQAVIPVLSDWFVAALELIGPPLSAIADAVANLVTEFPELAAGIAIVAAAFGLAVLTIGLIARPLVAAASGFVALKTALGGMGLSTILGNVAGSMGGVGTAIGKILAIGSRFLGWVGLVVLAFQQMWEHSEQFRESFSRLGDALSDLGQQLGEALAPAIDRIANESLPQLIDAFGELMGAAEPVFKFLGDSAARTIEGLAIAIEVLTPAIVALVEGIADTFASALEFITSLLETWGAVFRGDWEAVWQGLQDTASAAFTTIGEAVGTGLNVLTTLMQSFLDTAFPGWEQWWMQLGLDAMTSLADSFGMSAPQLVASVTSIANIIRDEFSRVLGGDTGYMEDLGLEMVSSLMAGISQGFLLGESVVAAAVATMVASIRTAVFEAISGMAEGFLQARDVVLVTVSLLVSSIIEEFNSLGVGLQFAMDNAKVVLVAAVFSWVTGMLGALTAGFIEMALVINGFIQTLPERFAAARDGLVLAVLGWFTGMQEQAVTGSDALVTQMETVPTRLEMVFAATRAMLESQVIGWFAGIMAQTISGTTQLLAEFTSLPGRIQGAISSLRGLLESEVIGWFAGMMAQTMSGITQILAQFATLPSRVIATISTLTAMLAAQVVMWFSAMLGAIGSGIAQVVAQMATIGPAIMGVLAGIPAQMAGVGQDMMLGLISGIMSMAADVASTAAAVVKGAVSAAEAALGINSPSRVFMEIGDYTGQGFVKGIEGQTKATQAAMHRMVSPPSPVTPGIGAAGGAGGQEINVVVQAQPGEDPSRVGRRAGEALAFEIRKLV